MLAGQIANTNAQAISEALAGIGVEVVWQTVVGDEVERIAAALRAALGRVEVVVVCGGLGPTHDDLTREGLAAATSRPLQRQASLVAALEDRFRRMGRQMAGLNLRQADLPTGATSIPNPVGTAPGVVLEEGPAVVYLLPGVPGEMAAMMAGSVLPGLVQRSSRTGGPAAALLTRVVRTAGIAEADLAERVAPVIAQAASGGPDGPRVAILASEGEVRVCLTAPQAGPAGEMLQALEAEVLRLLGPFVYGSGSDSLEAAVSARLRSMGLRLAVAESLTGGMLASRLVGVPGASDILLAGYVAYSADAKMRDLGVPAETIERCGLVSTETATVMAAGARVRAGADVGLSTTGEAGPAPAEADVGRVCVGLAWEGGDRAWEFKMGGTRDLIRRRTCTWALNQLRLWLAERAAG